MTAPATMQWGYRPLAGDVAMRWGYHPLAGESGADD
jgi:pyruvate carboxylase